MRGSFRCPPHPDIRRLVAPSHPDLKACVALNERRYDAGWLKSFDFVAVNVLLGWYSEEHLLEYLRFVHSSGVKRVVVFGRGMTFSEDLPELLAPMPIR